MRAYLLDDEELALRRLSRMLGETGRVEIAGSNVDPVAAAGEILALAPDVLFLDIQMPGLNGFELLQRLGESHPLVVFTTAYHEHALRAFEVHSVDYLLKPVEPSKLERALGKLERMRSGGETKPDVQELLRKLTSVLDPRPVYPSRLPSRTGERIEFVDLRQVTHFYAKDKLTFASTPAREFCVDGSIVELEAKLDPAKFLRIHRSTLINLDHIAEMHNWFGGKVLVRLDDPKRTELTVSRDRVKELRERLNL
ncbi:MAG: LytTR family DNA-binding domain-containing protein [Bryobacteraceae bacterium]|nr:LytTR family DNA-binding domain-containing protein [Bryobacteraceae bacterium]